MVDHAAGLPAGHSVRCYPARADFDGPNRLAATTGPQRGDARRVIGAQHDLRCFHRRRRKLRQHHRLRLARPQREWARGLQEARVKNPLSDIADAPHLGIREGAGSVTQRGCDVARQYAPELLRANHVGECPAVLVYGEQRQPDLFARRRVDRAPQIFRADNTRRVGEERREEQVAEVSEIVLPEVALVGDAHVEG